MLTQALKKATYEVVSVSTFREGFAEASSRSFDVIILDTHLPDGSGIDLCRQIRGTGRLTPIIFYSADAYAHQIEKAMEAGATTYLTKPLAPEDVEQAIERLVSQPDSFVA